MLIYVSGWQNELPRSVNFPVIRVLMQISEVTNWATSRKNVSSGIFEQVRFKPACTATETS